LHAAKDASLDAHAARCPAPNLDLALGVAAPEFDPRVALEGGSS
jgi:hypothetical protein